MNIHLIRKSTIEDFVIDNPQSSDCFSEWLTKIKHADWKKPEDIQNTFPTADILGKGSNRVVFNIGGNKYRLIIKYAFGDMQAHLFICWIGNHSEYDRLCKKNEQYNVSNY